MADETWSRKAILEVLRGGTPQDRLALLRESGFLDEHNDLTPRAKNWGHISHTAVEDDEDEQEHPPAAR